MVVKNVGTIPYFTICVRQSEGHIQKMLSLLKTIRIQCIRPHQTILELIGSNRIEGRCTVVIDHGISIDIYIIILIKRFQSGEIQIVE